MNARAEDSAIGRVDLFLEYLVVWIFSTSAVGLACVLAGWFLAPQVFLLGVSVTLVYAWKRHGSKKRSADVSVRMVPLILLILVALFFRLPGFDYVLGGQDDGIYVNMAEHINQTGGIDVQDEPLLKLQGTHFEQRYLSENRTVNPRIASEKDGHVGEYLAGIYVKSQKGNHLEFQFYHLFSMWMALVAGLFGSSMGIYGLTLFGLLSILMAYRLVLELTGSELAALIAGLLFAINPLHVFFSKLPVTAVVAQAFSLTAFTYLAIYWKSALSERRTVWLMLSVLGFTGLFFTRITGFLYIPFIIMLAIISIVLDHDSQRSRSIQYWALAITASYICSVVYGLHWSHTYSSDIYNIVGMQTMGGHLFAGVSALAVIMFSSWAFALIISRSDGHQATFAKFIGLGRRLIGPVVFIGLGLGLYKIYLLGWTDHYNNNQFMFARWGIAHQGWPAIKSTSLYTLFVYLGPLLIPAYLWLVAAKKDEPPTDYLRIFSGAFFVYAVLIMWIIPYGPFIARYLLSAVVPYLLLFVVICWHQRKPGIGKNVLNGVIALSLAYMLFGSVGQLGKRETKGLRASVQRLVAPVENGDVVLLDSLGNGLPNNSELKTTLLYTANKSVITVSKTSILDRAYLSELNVLYKNVYLISPKSDVPDGFTYDGSTQVTVWAFAHGHTLPHRLVPREDMRLYRFRLTKSILPLNTLLSFSVRGSLADWLDKGWSTPESWGAWSNAKRAVIHIDQHVLPDNKNGMRLVFKMRALVSPRHPIQTVNISVGGQRLAQYKIKYPNTSGNVSVDLLPSMYSGRTNINLDFDLPDAVSPKRLGISQDNRTLAIGLERVKIEPLN